jgi:hypothetical protein
MGRFAAEMPRTIVAGFVAPAIALSYGSSAALNGAFVVAIGVVWLFTGATLHYLVRRILGRLKS